MKNKMKKIGLIVIWLIMPIFLHAQEIKEPIIAKVENVDNKVVYDDKFIEIEEYKVKHYDVSFKVLYEKENYTFYLKWKDSIRKIEISDSLANTLYIFEKNNFYR